MPERKRKKEGIKAPSGETKSSSEAGIRQLTQLIEGFSQALIDSPEFLEVAGGYVLDFAFLPLSFSVGFGKEPCRYEVDYTVESKSKGEVSTRLIITQGSMRKNPRDISPEELRNVWVKLVDMALVKGPVVNGLSECLGGISYHQSGAVEGGYVQVSSVKALEKAEEFLQKLKTDLSS